MTLIFLILSTGGRWTAETVSVTGFIKTTMLPRVAEPHSAWAD